jgi:sigma-B regulation protein RsbU (phosphoserine phosphatase)
VHRDARLLVVDDVEQNVDLLVRRLRRFGYEHIDVARNGREALEILDAEPIDLMLLDIMMPELDGYAVLEHLNEQDRLADLPVIMISAIDELDDVVRCIELGAEDYLAKPFNATLLRARVQAVLEKKRLRDAAAAELDRLRAESLVARELQQGLLASDFPHAERGDPVSVHAVMHPALEVGGDLYDFFYPDDDTLCCMVGDVSGKGIAAGLFMARARSLLRWVTAHDTRDTGPTDLARILATVNAELCEGNAMVMFVTLCIALVDLRSGRVQFCSAGHNPPYLLRGSGGPAEVPVARDAALGIHDDAKFRTRTHQLEPEDRVLIYTDGITEARDETGAFYSEQRLEQTLGALHGHGARDGVDALVASVRDFAGDARQADDITAMMLHWHGPAERAFP